MNRVNAYQLLVVAIVRAAKNSCHIAGGIDDAGLAGIKENTVKVASAAKASRLPGRACRVRQAGSLAFFSRGVRAVAVGRAREAARLPPHRSPGVTSGSPEKSGTALQDDLTLVVIQRTA
jgi:hypothetical protein